MPVKVVKRGAKFRVIEADSGKLATTDKGTARDGGGHETEAKAERQARAINMHIAKK